MWPLLAEFVEQCHLLIMCAHADATRATGKVRKTIKLCSESSRQKPSHGMVVPSAQRMLGKEWTLRQRYTVVVTASCSPALQLHSEHQNMTGRGTILLAT
jgi:hypothetical protein